MKGCLPLTIVRMTDATESVGIVGLSPGQAADVQMGVVDEAGPGAIGGGEGVGDPDRECIEDELEPGPFLGEFGQRAGEPCLRECAAGEIPTDRQPDPAGQPERGETTHD